MCDEVIKHYNSLVEENNDPVYDPPILQEYMNKWDGQEFLLDLNVTSTKSVLEIGVGTGRVAIKILDKCQEFTGIDIANKVIERASENLSKYYNKLLICADFMTYEFNRKYDIIYSTLMFMHIKDKEKAILKIADLLKDNGRFVLSIEKTKSSVIDYGTRMVKTYPDDDNLTREYLNKANLHLVKQYETEFSVIFVAVKAGFGI